MSASEPKFPHVLLCVCGCAQAEVIPRLTATLVRHPDVGRMEVIVVASPSALPFFEKAEVEQTTGRRVFVRHEDGTEEFPVPHINLAEWADLVLVYPASANTLAKVAHGVCDTLVTSLALTATCPVFFGPTMNDRMSEKAVTLRNIEILKGDGFHFIPKQMARVTIRATGETFEKPYVTEAMVLAVCDIVFGEGDDE